MIKKITLLTVAVGAVAALVAPGVASATKLTMPSGTLVPVNTAITGTANNTTIPLKTETETFGTLECTNIMLNGKVTKNTGATAEMAAAEGSTATGCSLEGEVPVAVTEFALGNVSSTEVGAETGTGTYSAHFTMHIPPLLTCTFSTNGQNGVLHFRVNTDILILTPVNLSSSCGTATLSGEVTLETKEGGPVTLS